MLSRLFPRSLCRLLVALSLLAPVPEAASAQEPPLIIKAATLQQVPLDSLIGDLSQAGFVFIGEQHTNREHHVIQLQVIRSLREAGIDVGIALEMFYYEDRDDLDRWVRGEMGSLDFFNLYVSRWDMESWSLYSDIFYYAQEHRLPMAGINIPRELVRQVAQGGFAALGEGEAQGLSDVECDAKSKYVNLMGLAMFGRSEKGEVFRRFCEAQVFWDTAMAENLLKVAGENPDRLWVVMAGNFHAWKHGIPYRVSTKSDATLRIILPSDDKTFLTYDVLRSDADYVWWIDSAVPAR